MEKGTITDSMRDRALGALWGLAMGDALGMPTQTLTRAEISAAYGPVTGFRAPFDDHPVSHGLRAGQVTDDTEQAVLLAKRLLADRGRFDDRAWAQDLVDWEADVARRGLRDLLGPSTKRAITAILAGADPATTGRHGTTNGAAMRIAPVGIAFPADDRHAFVNAVACTARITHDTGEAIAGAAAVAAVISAGVDGAGFEDAVLPALEAAREGQGRGHAVGAGDMCARIEAALGLAHGDEEALWQTVGTSVATSEAVPAAFAAVARAGGDPWEAALLAARAGDDTDTIGAMAAAMAGACRGYGALPSAQVAELRVANDLPLDDLVGRLLGYRASCVGLRQA